jgi:hypothetical protein
MTLLLRTILLRTSGAYVCVIVVCELALFFLPSFDKVGHVEHGCYLTEPLFIPSAECRGFPGSSVVGFLLNLPFALMFLPMIGLYGVVSGEMTPKGIGLLAFGLVLWTPVVYLMWHGLKSLIRRLQPA